MNEVESLHVCTTYRIWGELSQVLLFPVNSPDILKTKMHPVNNQEASVESCSWKPFCFQACWTFGKRYIQNESFFVKKVTITTVIMNIRFDFMDLNNSLAKAVMIK